MRLKSTSNLDLGSKKVDLVLDMNVLCDIEEQLDVNIMSQADFWEKLGFRELRVIVWAMLYKETPRPSIDEVGAMLSEASLEEIGAAIGRLWSQDAKDSGKKKPKADSVDPTKG